MLRLDKVSAAYGAVTALRDGDIAVEAGEIVALIGSNGAGKSTTLKTISGLVRPSGGTIEFQGEDITGLSPEDIVARGIIQVPEGRRVFPRLTVQQNLAAGAYSPRAHGKEKSTRERVFALFPRLYERRRQRNRCSSCWTSRRSAWRRSSSRKWQRPSSIFAPTA
jgi:branched-chain amino acid transport system ATP-binding protein